MRNRFTALGRMHNRIMAAHTAAQMKYVGHPFRGRLVIVQSEQFGKWGSLERWQQLAPDGIDYYEFPGTTHREVLLQEPYVEQTARLIAVSLERILLQRPADGVAPKPEDLPR